MGIKSFKEFRSSRAGAAALVLTLAAGLLAAAALVGGEVVSTCACGDPQDRVLYPVNTGGGRSGPAGRPVVPEWEVLGGVSYENLTVFPVVSRAETNTSGFATLDEALASGEAVVSESGSQIIRRSRDGRPVQYSGGPQVNQLVLINRGKRPLVLLAGEVVTGGKQDRVIAKDRIVPPGAEPLPLDVFCVEHGRWTGASDQFNASKFMVHPSVREKAAVAQKQDEVWAAVRRGTTANPSQGRGVAGGVATTLPPPALPRETVDLAVAEARTESYAKVYHGSRIGQSVETFAAEISRRFEKTLAGLKGERVIGVVVAYGSEVAWSDAFASEPL
ncbi:MAG: hypothetical protein HY233_13450, partial [Acidobacteriales bacterium]|nr:hypothetical protein [Terriglobales bacterium]